MQIDTGTDLRHPDITDNLWINPAEAAGPGATSSTGYKNDIDDDKNSELSHLHQTSAAFMSSPHGCLSCNMTAACTWGSSVDRCAACQD